MSDDNSIAEFISITNASKALAEQYLSRNNNDLVGAVEDYYANNEHQSHASHPQSRPFEQHEPPMFGSSTLAQAGFGSQKTQKRAKQPKGITTFRDLNNEDDDSEDDRTNHNFFTGGEKSALQVEDPNKDRKKDSSIVDQIFQKARDQMNMPDGRPSARAQQQQQSERAEQFAGTGFKLGDGNEPSEAIEDPRAHARELMNRLRPKKVNREITFWKQGFTVGDSLLYSYDDPKNQRILNEIEQGRVPISILEVDPGDDVDVTVSKRTDEDYVPPKKKVGGYHGAGQRLGSPVPGETDLLSRGQQTPAEKTVDDKSSSEAKKQQSAAGQGEGDTLIQIRFANGKRTSQKFYASDPITVVYEFVRNHENNSGNGDRSFTLSHAFPVKPIEESNDITVADAKLSNVVVVQRWS
ncbi:uncharacterized protein LODBEIA_P08890 [Lodderomyces beijingensis]|uniref:UBX domain-containing protein n=1 Tax=Lodderomyces beijingensis TaxID=1775926 RepID=A0ABP0ZHN9_9ASCO